MKTGNRKTPLYAWHVTHGANMGTFGGYEMPLWYSAGAKKEHLAVINNAGIFDTSHMALILVSGPGSLGLLQTCFSRDLTACVDRNRLPLQPGKSVYGVFLNEQGGLIDDAVVTKIAHDLYMIVVNAGMGGEITGHLMGYMEGQDVTVKDLTDRAGKADLQGPRSAQILRTILANPEKVLQDMTYFSSKGFFDQSSPLSGTVSLTDGTPVLLSRTGYSGEFGFEIITAPENLNRLWDACLRRGEEVGLIPCGLAARDSLRVGAVLPLSHQDIGSWPFINHPWMFTLPITADGAKFTKRFVGSEALLSINKAAYTYAFAGDDLRKVSAEEPAVVLDAGGDPFGEVLTCVTDMAIGRVNDRIYSIASPDKPEDFSPRGLSCGFIKVNRKLAPGQSVELEDSRRRIKVVVVEDIRPDRTARHSIKGMF